MLLGVFSPRKSLSRAAYRITIKNQSLGTTSLLAIPACLPARQLDLRDRCQHPKRRRQVRRRIESASLLRLQERRQLSTSSSSHNSHIEPKRDSLQSQQIVLTPHRFGAPTEFASRFVVEVLVLVLGFADRSGAPAGSIISHPCQAS